MEITLDGNLNLQEKRKEAKNGNYMGIYNM